MFVLRSNGIVEIQNICLDSSSVLCTVAYRDQLWFYPLWCCVNRDHLTDKYIFPPRGCYYREYSGLFSTVIWSESFIFLWTPCGETTEYTNHRGQIVYSHWGREENFMNAKTFNFWRFNMYVHLCFRQLNFSWTLWPFQFLCILHITAKSHSVLYRGYCSGRCELGTASLPRRMKDFVKRRSE